jgi:hypothetical protein
MSQYRYPRKECDTVGNKTNGKVKKKIHKEVNKI